MRDGLYTMDYTHCDNRYTRKVLVEGIYYRFTDDHGRPLPGSIPLRVDIAIKSDAQAIFTPVDLDGNDGPAGRPAKLPTPSPIGSTDCKPTNRIKSSSRFERVMAAVCGIGFVEGLGHG